jgi:hypothetical protein
VTREQIFFLAVLGVLPFALAVWIGTGTGRRGWFYGLLSWLGVFLLVYLGEAPPNESRFGLERFTQCHHCGLLIPAGSQVCRHCQRPVMPPLTQTSR